MKVSPLLGYVSEIEMLSPPPQSNEAPVAHELVEDITGRAGAAIGAVVGRLADVGERSPEVRAAIQEAMDERDDEGRTQRERLDEARQQMQRLGGAAATKGSDGGSLIGGLLGGLSEAMEQLGDDRPDGDDPNGDDPSR